VSTVVAALPQLIHGMLTTFAIAAGAMLLAVVAGFALGIARSYASRALDAPLVAIIELVRGIPLLVLMYLVFFGLPQLGVRISSNPAAIVALGLYAAALASEIVRGAIASIPRGQSEAAAALGLGKLTALWRVILPQALRRMIPPFVALFALIVESSSLSALIDVNDLLQSARTFAEAHLGSAFPLYLTVLVLYFLINYPISATSRRLEKRLA
jgi:His/Glu/Gln/Arg/opine family amino acid ABC transporter permease subunit